MPQAFPIPKSLLTILLVEGVVTQAQGGPAAPALEAAAVEEASLGAGSLQDVDTAPTEVAGVTVLPCPLPRWLRGDRTGWGGTGGLAPTLARGCARSHGGTGQGFAPLAALGLFRMGEGVATLGSGKPVGSGNKQGGAGNMWAFACAALVPALGLALPGAGAPLVPTCPELDCPFQGDARTNLPWVHHDGLRRLRSVSIQPRVQLQVTQGEGQPPTLPPGQLHPSRAPLGAPGADPPQRPCGSSWPQCPSGQCPANPKGVVRVGSGTGFWCVMRVCVGFPHLGTFVCQVPALLQLAEEEDGPSCARGRQC